MGSHKEKANIKIIPGGNQMSLIRDTEEVLKFLEFAGRKLILNETAINCRLTACNNLFSVLHEDEDNLDHILANLDVLVHRFSNGNPNVRASTLKVYKSRVKSSVEDFRAWSADPFAWERAVTDKAKAQGMGNRREKREKKEAAAAAAPSAPQRTRKAAAVAAPATTAVETTPPPTESAAVTTGVRKVSFPIRPDFSVEMSIPPEGLTLKELHRLGLFLYPYCVDIDPTLHRWPSLPN